MKDIENSLVSVTTYPFWPTFVYPLNSWCLEFTLNSSMNITSVSSSRILFCITAPSRTSLVEFDVVDGAGFLSNFLKDQFRSFFSHRIIVESLTLFSSGNSLCSLSLIFLAVNFWLVLVWTRESIYSLCSSFRFLLLLELYAMFSSFLSFISSLTLFSNFLNIFVRYLKFCFDGLDAPFMNQSQLQKHQYSFIRIF